jgi:DNA-binding response OmpR family regulator
MPRILVVEDDVQLAQMVALALSCEHTVDVVCDGTSALEKTQATEFDLIILDWQLPDVSGIVVAKAVRDRGQLTPILMLTSKVGVDNTVEGLDSGADDYLTKPFEMRILKAKLNSLLRGVGGGNKRSELRIGDLLLDRKKHQVTLAGRLINLPALEFDLLSLLMSNPERIFSLDTLRDKLWGGHCADDTVRSCIRRIRDQLGPDSDDIIVTIPNLGYTIKQH